MAPVAGILQLKEVPPSYCKRAVVAAVVARRERVAVMVVTVAPVAARAVLLAQAVVVAVRVVGVLRAQLQRVEQVELPEQAELPEQRVLQMPVEMVVAVAARVTVTRQF